MCKSPKRSPHGRKWKNDMCGVTWLSDHAGQMFLVTPVTPYDWIETLATFHSMSANHSRPLDSCYSTALKGFSRQIIRIFLSWPAILDIYSHGLLNRSALTWPGLDPENSERGEWDTWQSKTAPNPPPSLAPLRFVQVGLKKNNGRLRPWNVLILLRLFVAWLLLILWHIFFHISYVCSFKQSSIIYLCKVYNEIQTSIITW